MGAHGSVDGQVRSGRCGLPGATAAAAGAMQPRTQVRSMQTGQAMQLAGDAAQAVNCRLAAQLSTSIAAAVAAAQDGVVHTPLAVRDEIHMQCPHRVKLQRQHGAGASAGGVDRREPHYTGPRRLSL